MGKVHGFSIVSDFSPEFVSRLYHNASMLLTIEYTATTP